MAEKTKQHFVPQFYLKNFSIDKFFNIYNIKKGLIKNVPYGSQCYKNNFYGKDKVYETKLSGLENKWSSSIKNIINNPQCVSDLDDINIKEFCCFQYLRTESSYIQTQNAFYDITTKIIPIISQFYSLNIKEQDVKKYAYNYVKKNEDPEKTMKSLIDNADNLSATLNNLKLVVLINDTNIDYISSDNPVIIGNEFQNHNGLGLDCIGFYCLCPISPKHYIALVDDKIYYKFREKHYIIIKESIVRKLNLLQFKNALSNIFFRDEKTLYELKKDLKYYEIAKKGEMLEEYNSKYNNFLSVEKKSAANDMFLALLEANKEHLISFMSSKLIDNSILDLFDIDKNAKPFQNLLNYNFHRSATFEKLTERIAFMRSCTSDEINKIIKHDSSKNEQKLINLYEEFLYDYFGYKKTTN